MFFSFPLRVVVDNGIGGEMPYLCSGNGAPNFNRFQIMLKLCNFSATVQHMYNFILALSRSILCSKVITLQNNSAGKHIADVTRAERKYFLPLLLPWHIALFKRSMSQSVDSGKNQMSYYVP